MSHEAEDGCVSHTRPCLVCSYTGLIYNDCFSKSFNLFGSSWTTINNTQIQLWLRTDPERAVMLTPESQITTSPYPIGVDPAWNLAEANRLNFLNSMKMKGSVIIGT